MKWISVIEDMPENGQAVLVFPRYPKGTMFNMLHYPLVHCFYYIAEYCSYSNKFYLRGTEGKFLDHIVSWMPLPDVPKEETCTT